MSRKETFTWMGFDALIRRPTTPHRIGVFEIWEPEDPRTGIEGVFGTAFAVYHDLTSAGRFPVAAGCLRDFGFRAAWLETMGVDPEKRGKGIGSRLLRAAMTLLKREGVEQIWLSAAPEEEHWREPLIRFYERHGFAMALPACRDERAHGPLDIMSTFGS